MQRWSAPALIGLMAAFPLVPARLAAQQQPRPGGEASPLAGFLAFDQDFRVSDGVSFRGLKDSPAFGARAGYNFTRRIGVEASLVYSAQSFDPTTTPGSSALDVRYLTFVPEAVAPLASGNVIPFVAAGIGLLSFSVDAESAADESSTSLVGSLGGGLKIPVGRSILVRLDARDFAIRQRAGRDVTSIVGGDGAVRHNIGLTAGLAFQFGGPGDADRDGVYDDHDSCPSTAPGVPVDEAGCVLRIPEGPPPIKTDSDKDGVSDGLDKCPRTRAGAVVDLDGCPVGQEGTPPPRGR